MADDAPFPEPDDAARSDPDSASWEPYQSPQGSRGGALRLLRRHAFSITAGAAALAIGLLIYFAPTRLGPAPSASQSDRGQAASTLSVSSQPSSAVVIVGADTAGVTPINDYPLPPGTYLVTVDRANYGSLDTVLTLSAGQSAALAPRFSRDEPPSGRSSDEPAASPPPSPDAPASSDETPDPAPGRPTANSRPGTSSAATDGDIAPVTGTLVLRATPERATVTFDGEEVGGTPATLDEVPTGTYDVTFSRSGYGTVARRVDITASDTATVTATLEQQTGHLRVLVRPWGSIYIDDQRRAENSDVWYDTALPAGAHTVTARHPALGEQSRSVTVAPQDTQSVIMDLREQ
ncbi:PEGA domain-containing protein [Salinibacter grassmerensis]|uniref:PEGA domain-containing protein n=1 Tax=Salinibacter grassmerensis TaxID=3040353 RepID=UPI0021E807BB|nr:PEGA domain-containing protein [Salinibacter grassmerensis]